MTSTTERKINIIMLLAALSAVFAPGVGLAQPADTLYISVEQAVTLALERGVEAAMARQRVLAAEARVGEALSYALPQIDFGATYTRNLKKPVIFFEFEPGKTQSFEIGQDNAWTAGISLRQTVWASGRVMSGYKMAKERAVAAGSAGDDAAAAIARDVKAAYYLALLAGEQTDISRQSLDQAERNVQNITARVNKGVASRFEKLRSEVEAASRKPVLTRARNAEAITLESLKRLLGVPLDRPVVLTDKLSFEPYLEDRDETVQHALETRRDLRSVRLEAQASEYQLRAQAANDRPMLYLNGNVAWQGETSKNFFPGDQESAESASLGLTLAWPLLDGFRNRHLTKQAQAGLKLAQLAVKQAEDFVTLEVRSNWSDVLSIAEEISAAEGTVEVAREAYDIAMVRYETGLSTLIEFLDAELVLTQSKLALKETLYRYNVAVARLDYSKGEGPNLEEAGGED